MKALILVLVTIALVGCNTFGSSRPEPITETVYQEVRVPVSNVPIPPNTDCPQLRINTLTPEQKADDGEVAKAYRIAVRQLEDCSLLRQTVIDKYREMSELDEEKIETLKSRSSGPTGPFSTSASGSESDSPQPFKSAGPPTPIVQFDDEEVLRQISVERTFEDIQTQFRELQRKDYDIE